VRIRRVDKERLETLFTGHAGSKHVARQTNLLDAQLTVKWSQVQILSARRNQ
jgi:hypothetical protein